MNRSVPKRLRQVFTGLLAIILVLGLLPGALAADGFAAEDLTLQPGSDISQINLNWYAETGTNDARVKFTPVGDSGAAVLTAEAAEYAAVDGKVACKATVTGLVAGTEYTYQVSNDRGVTWSQAYSFTADNGDGAFTFAFVGDPQLKNRNQDGKSLGKNAAGTAATELAISQGWEDTIDALAAFDVDFIASAGDQVDTTGGNEAEYTMFFAPEQMQSLPFAAAVGNHDRNTNFLYHYNLPNVQSVSAYINASNSDKKATSTTGNYYYSYDNALFVVLNDSDYPGSAEAAAPYIAAFRATLQAAVTAYPEYDWLIVQHHKSTESVAQHVADDDIQYYVEAGFETLMDEFHVDFVLAGHDHVYARSYAMYGGERVSEDTDALIDPAGTVYLTCNTGSGLKYYDIFSSGGIYVSDNTSYPYLANGLAGSVEYLKGVYPLSTDVAAQSYIPGYTIIEVEGSTITFTTYSTYAAADDSSDTTASGTPLDTFTVTKTNAQESRTEGVANSTAAVLAELTARYDSGVVNEDGGSTEIVVYNSDNDCAYAVNGTTGHLVKIDLSGVSADGSTVDTLTGVHIPVKEIMQTYCPDFAYGDMTSVAVSTAADVLAVAIQAEAYDETGKLALFTYDGRYLAAFDTGVQPDMVTFTEDGLTALTADEGEPREGSSGTDPKGSVTIVALNTNELSASSVSTVTFDAFDSRREALTNAGVVLLKGAAPSVDLEPEYIAVSGGTAYVSLQEANAIAVLDLTNKSFTGVYPLGLQDYGTTALDLLKDGEINITTQSNVYGIKMPDGISVYTSGGRTYLLTANEGDSRADWDGLDNEVESTSSPTGGVTTSEDVVWFDASQYDGLDQSKAYLFGGRSFSIYEATATGLTLVYDSGSDFETITAASFPDNFNCSNDKIKLDNRSGKKGPEPENVTVGAVGSHTYAYVALERIGGVMVYDITSPAGAGYVNYINSRDFSAKVAGDVSPEGLAFVAATDSPTGNALLLTANEVSGTVCAYGLRAGVVVTPTTPSTPAVVTPSVWANPFHDVAESDWYYEAVAYAQENGLMAGTAGTTFSPALTASRGMVAAILYRLEGATATGSNPFRDVAAGSYYEAAITWAAANGLVEGYGDGTFAPDAPVTRAQLAAILYRYAQYKGYTLVTGAALGFPDAGEAGTWAVPALQWACAAGLLEGSAGRLDPNGSATRAQLAAVLYRFHETVAA